MAVLLVLHLGSTAAHLLGFVPQMAPRGEGLPETPGAAVVAVAATYLDMTATRQRRDPLSPAPAEWVRSMRIVVHSAGTRPLALYADTLAITPSVGVAPTRLIPGGRTSARDGVGVPGWADFYRPFLAGYLCRELAGPGRTPFAVELLVEARRTIVPWEAGRVGGRVKLEHLGRYGCRPPAPRGRAA